jgi:hypothetical protein
MSKPTFASLKRERVLSLLYALENAAEFLRNEEWPEADGGVQERANRDGAKRIRTIANRIARRNGLKEIK